MKQPLRVLVVEDHRDIAANIADFLEARGHLADFAYDGVSGMHLALTRELDAIVLDIMLPGMDGYTFCRKLREDAKRDTPVLMLTARDAVGDRLQGFRAGTDDYLIKPFSLEELEARLLALFRRCRPSRGALLRVGDLELDLGTRAVRRAGRAIDLNPTSFRILTELMQASPNAVTRERLEVALWGDAPPASDALRSQIYLLRQAIDRPFAPFARPLLVTLHGVGYRLVAGDEP
ncbi:response regulator transcription factor [Sorangium sp. So ce1128]